MNPAALALVMLAVGFLGGVVFGVWLKTCDEENQAPEPPVDIPLPEWPFSVRRPEGER